MTSRSQAIEAAYQSKSSAAAVIAPRADILVIPGGNVMTVKDDAQTLTWIKDKAVHAELTMSVCNGAVILANTGLMKGLAATTTRGTRR